MNSHSHAVDLGGGLKRKPAYLQIQNHFMDLIKRGKISDGQKLPTELEISKQFSVSRATVQSAMGRLVLEGWVTRQAGKGTFALEQHADLKVNIDFHNIQSFENEAAFQGKDVSYRLIGLTHKIVSEKIANQLGMQVGEKTYSLERVRQIGDLIIGCELRYFSPKLNLDIPVNALNEEPTHKLIENYLGLRIGKISVALKARIASKEKAILLSLDTGAALLVRSHVIYSTDGEVILCGESEYVEPYEFHYEATLGE